MAICSKKFTRQILKLWRPLPPLMLLTLVAFLEYVYVRLQFIPQAHVNTQQAVGLLAQIGVKSSLSLPEHQILWLAASFHVVLLLFLFCFFRAALSDPGPIPKNNDPSKDIWRVHHQGQMFELTDKDDTFLLNLYQHDQIFSKKFDVSTHLTDEDQSRLRRLVLVERKNEEDKYRFCRCCLNYKPDRCHHCRRCDRCVLKMDHHCPWIGNCVGFRNHKFFSLMLLYALVTDFMYCVLMFSRFVLALKTVMNSSSELVDEITVLLAWFIAFLIFLPLSGFTFLHFFLGLINMTTIEFEEKYNGDERLAMNRWKISHVKFNRGWYLNFRENFGSKWYLWLVPVMSDYDDADLKRGVGDGLYYYVPDRHKH